MSSLKTNIMKFLLPERQMSGGPTVIWKKIKGCVERKKLVNVPVKLFIKGTLYEGPDWLTSSRLNPRKLMK